jgi:putative protease
MSEIRTNMKIYRNNDHQFLRLLEKEPAERKILISIDLKESPKGFLLSGKDEDGNEAVYEIETEKKPAIKRENAQENIISQLKKIGNTIFECSEVRLDLEDIYFLPVSVLNNAKRQLVEKMIEAREKNYPRKIGGVIENFAIYPEKHLTYLGNCLNEKACDFYRRHGVETIEPAAESGLDMKGKLVMVTKYCLKKELGLCKDRRQGACAEPLILEDEDGRQLRIEFCCGRCGMEIRNS